MKKIIVIVNGQAQPDPVMLALLREHFPDMGVEIVRRKEEAGDPLFHPEQDSWLGEFVREIRW